MDTRESGNADFSSPANLAVDLYIRRARAEEVRRRILFRSVLCFLAVDAALFILGVIWASYVVAYERGDWHLYAAALFPGVLGAVIALMFLKAIFRVPKQDTVKTEDVLPTSRAWLETARDLSQD